MSMVVHLRSIGYARQSMNVIQPIRVDSVVGLAYDRIRAMIVGGELPARGRLGQGELAERLGISRTSVREALRRLTGDGLVEFHTNRGFFVADVGLEAVPRRLEVRMMLEPGIALIAAERRTAADLATLEQAIVDEERAADAETAHDASRAFHVAVARATQNDEFVRTLEALWIVDIGRRLLAQRRAAPSWQREDVREHGEILTAIEDHDPQEAHDRMKAHVLRALLHWQPAVSGTPTPPPRSY